MQDNDIIDQISSATNLAQSLQLPTGVLQVLPLLQGLDISSLTSALNGLNSTSFDVSFDKLSIYFQKNA